jgi:hypothetical protein
MNLGRSSATSANAHRPLERGEVRDPELVRPVNCQIFGAIGIDRLVVVAVGRGHIAAPSARLEIVLAHQSPDLRVIDDQPAMTEFGANAPPAIEFEFSQIAAIASTMAVSSAVARSA